MKLQDTHFKVRKGARHVQHRKHCRGLAALWFAEQNQTLFVELFVQLARFDIDPAALVVAGASTCTRTVTM